MRPKIINPDTVIQQTETGMILSNFRVHQHFWVCFNLFMKIIGRTSEGPFQLQNLSTLSNIDGLKADPSNMSMDAYEVKYFDDADEAISILRDKFILDIDKNKYDLFIQNKNSILDKNKLGNFHQRLGQEIMLNKLGKPATWWHNQKYDPDTGRINNNLYYFIQEKFLNDFFSKNSFSGKKILDFGCGSGMASSLFISKGAEVIGADLDAGHLEKAKERLPSAFTPILLKQGEITSVLSNIDQEFDAIWISDVLLFYFYPLDPKGNELDATQLLNIFNSKLKAGGDLFITLSHGTFWLTPWLGFENRPFTIITEYFHKTYGVSPNLNELSESLSNSNYLIKQIKELVPNVSADETCDLREYNFAKNFPLWWFFHCVKPQ